ncbi:chorion class B protein M2807-like [Pieris brassicae]|uniref:chorion class B protein M2807-like n=1 Tax=Pieris brassicae TaxID=7116 RepID=UPI001E65F652|nr:chorion class B protein M2807-like [Pieris brassicae]
MFKILVLVQALIQVITSQCICSDRIPNWAGIVSPSSPGGCSGFPPVNLPYDQYNAIDFTSLSASGCGLPMTTRSSSPIAPGVLSITSENVIEGPVSVYGQLPFLSAVAFEGSIPTHGYGGVSYGCGNGNVGILSETSGFESAYEASVRPYEVPSVRGLELSGGSCLEIGSGRAGFGRGVVPAFPPARPCGCQY